MDELVEAITQVFPRALVQWEHFSNRNAFQVLDRHRQRVLSFNDDIQGTGAIVVAGIRSALRRVGRPLSDTRAVFLGARASGAGCALALRDAMRAGGVPERELGRRVLCLDSKGLILKDRPGLDGAKRAIAADPALTAGWPRAADGTLRLADVVHQFAPHVLIGVSGQPGAFTESIVRDMMAAGPPIVLALSNPTSKIEATPAEVLEWTRGAAIVGTGSPFPPVDDRWNGRSSPRRIGQGNNVFVFPGVGLGATAVGARWLPDSAFAAAAEAVFEFTSEQSGADDAIFPPLSSLRAVSRRVAIAVGRSTGGLLNVVTKTGTNETRGSAHYFYRGKSLTKDDALGTPSNIDNQHQFGGAVGGATRKDKQFYFLAFDVQRRNGPVVTKFAREFLMWKYIDGNVRDSQGGVTHPRYPDPWYERIVKERGDAIKAPRTEKP